MLATVAILVPFAGLIGPLVWMAKSTGTTRLGEIAATLAAFNS